jgi:hypothetical protein
MASRSATAADAAVLAVIALIASRIAPGDREAAAWR